MNQGSLGALKSSWEAKLLQVKALFGCQELFAKSERIFIWGYGADLFLKHNSLCPKLLLSPEILPGPWGFPPPGMLTAWDDWHPRSLGTEEVRRSWPQKSDCPAFVVLSQTPVCVWQECCGLIGHTLQHVWLRMMSVPYSAQWQWKLAPTHPSGGRGRVAAGLRAGRWGIGGIQGLRGWPELTSSKRDVYPTRPEAPSLISVIPTSF